MKEIQSTEQLHYLPVSAVAEVLYCPRNFYYRVIEGIDDTNAHMLEGKLQEEKREQRQKITRDACIQVRSVKVASESLKLLGVVDCLEEKNAFYPVEYKKGLMKNSLSDDVQLCAQAMILEEKLNCVIEKGYIYYVGSCNRREVLFHEDLRVLVENTVNKAMTIIETGEMPLPVADHRCNGCALENRCMPFETSYLKKTGLKPSRPVPGVNLGRVLYVDEPGAKVKKKGTRLVIERENQTLADIPLCNVDQVVLVGGVNLSTPAVKMILDNGISMAYLTSKGNFRGMVQPPVSRNVHLRLAQFSAYFDQQKKHELARCIVTGKLVNMRSFLIRYNRRLKDQYIEAAIKNMGLSLGVSASANDLDSLRGIEGMASRVYFSAMSRLIKPELLFEFDGRNRRPPRDPVNALLSYAYTLLAKDLQSAIQLVGLDPYVGYLHQPVYGRPALALDLMEEFRAVIADSVVLSAINRGVVGPDDFEYTLGGCLLNAPGRKKFYRAYEERRHCEIKHPVFKYRLSYLRIFELQARILGKFLQGELEKYIPFVVR